MMPPRMERNVSFLGVVLPTPIPTPQSDPLLLPLPPPGGPLLQQQQHQQHQQLRPPPPAPMGSSAQQQQHPFSTFTAGAPGPTSQFLRDTSSAGGGGHPDHPHSAALPSTSPLRHSSHHSRSLSSSFSPSSQLDGDYTAVVELQQFQPNLVHQGRTSLASNTPPGSPQRLSAGSGNFLPRTQSSTAIVRVLSSPAISQLRQPSPSLRPRLADATQFQLSPLATSPVAFPFPQSSSPIRKSRPCISMPSIRGSQVFITHVWVTINYWICGGRRVDAKRAALFIIIVSGLIFGALIAVRRPIFFNKPGPSKSPRRLTNNTGSNRTYSGDESILQLDSGYPFQPEWLESNLHGSKKYGIVIDAGSSGTRLMVYSWLVSELMDDNFPTVEAASSESGPWRKSVEPGLSSLTTDPSAANVAKYLSPLLDFAEAMIPKGQQADTPIYLFATAGMRLVPEVTRSQLMRHACDIVSRSYSFSIQAGCERQFRVISGESEGLFGWITVNYLLPDGFKRRLNPIESVGTYGFLELGGGSAQVAIEASHQITASKPDYSKSLVLRTVGGQEFVYTVDVTSFLGFGMNEARRVYLESLFAKYSETRIKGGKSLDKPILKRNWPGLPVEATHPPRPHTHPLAEGTISQRDLSSADGSTIEDPCLPRGLEMPESISVGQITLIGTGSIDDCREQLRQNVLLISRASNSSCSKDDPVCLLPRVRAALRTPKLSQNTLVKLIGTSEFFYTPEGVFGLGGSYSYSEMYSASSRYCSTAWNDILQLYQSSMDDDGLLRRADAVTVTRKRLRKQCFRAAWVMTLLHDGFGIPKDGPDALDSVALPARSGKLLARRELDLDKDGDGSGAEGWSTLSREVRSRRKVRRSLSKGSRNVAARVEEFRSQAFSGDISDFVQGPVSLTSAIEIEGTPISWTLGVMLLHVASTIPPLERLPENSESPTVSGTPGAIFGENRGDDSSNGRFLAEAVISWTALLVLVIVVLSAVGVTCRSIHRRRRGSKGSLTVLPLLNTQVQFGAQSQSSPSGGNPSLENVNFSGGRSSLNPLLLNGRASSDQGSSPRDSPLLTPLGRDEGLPPPTGASSAWRRSAGGSMDIDLESYIGEDAGLVMSSRYETGLSAQHGGLVPSASSAGPLNESASSSSGSLTSWFSSRRTKRSY